MVSSPPLSAQDVVCKADHLIESNVDNETVLLDMQSEAYFGMNEVGSEIWSMLDQATPINALQERLLEVYDISPQQCLQELLEYLNGLQRDGLLQVVSST